MTCGDGCSRRRGARGGALRLTAEGAGPRRSAAVAGVSGKLCEAVELLNQLHLRGASEHMLLPAASLKAHPAWRGLRLRGRCLTDVGSPRNLSQPSATLDRAVALLQDAIGNAGPDVLGPGFLASEVHGLSAPWSCQAAPVPQCLDPVASLDQDPT